MSRESETSWKVLIVDDEPAVHEVTRLVLAGARFEGSAVELLSAGSAAQARELLTRHDDIALTLLDVVMETDDAGIALVEHIRQQRGDSEMQIVLRTGQPGMAPERDVIQRYEINGYFLKTEVTAQRLHSIVISGIRGYRLARSLRAAAERARDEDSRTPPEGIESGLAQALAAATVDEGACVWQFRPEVALSTNQVTGVELVPRWKTSKGLQGLACLDAALPAGPARRRVASRLVDVACGYARACKAARRVSVPLVGESPQVVGSPDAIIDLVRVAALPAGALDLLIGESALRTGGLDAGVVARLRALGATVTLADFGAQAMSLRRLGELAPDRVKLHRHFVQGAADDPERALLARSLIALAHTLNIVAVADGIASDSDAQFFKWEGCEVGQGDALAPPGAFDDVIDVGGKGRPGWH